MLSQLGCDFWLEHRKGKAQGTGLYWSEKHREELRKANLWVPWVFLINTPETSKTEQKDSSLPSFWTVHWVLHEHRKDLKWLSKSFENNWHWEKQPTETSLECETLTHPDKLSAKTKISMFAIEFKQDPESHNIQEPEKYPLTRKKQKV